MEGNGGEKLTGKRERKEEKEFSCEEIALPSENIIS